MLNLEEMLTKFISVLETHFQNTKTVLKNQQVLIQGLKTQIGQLTKLFSERPQGSLPSDTESNPREKINAITFKMRKERRLQIKELDEWRTQKLRTPDKPKSSQDELNISTNQPQVGDKVLLDATDPRITTSEPNEEIPLTVLSIFPYGTIEVIHPKFGTFKVNNTCLKPYVDKVDSRDEECKLLAPS
ncbi:hypothetical protein GOBAR_AA10408 [Gossypium barbadense]|uniref:Uncharacterized protein n=1 Tax=Gossypium barbadense TaxID=3634 RepID=A0A2P5Y3Q7_GOSBA|nr:hypothetical protein GOBAR_AA10408 [Gossypium barbadense]